MSNTQINYYLRPTNSNQDSLSAFNKIIEYLMTFVGDIEVKKESDTSAIIYYLGTPTTAMLALEKTGQITVSIAPSDNVIINLIKNISQNIGFRIYNSKINCYLPNDVNIYDLTTIKLEPNVKNVLNLYQLTPLFQYRDTLIFFCLNKKMEVVLVNRHLLEYLISDEGLKINKQSLPLRGKSEFSTKVAENISQFVALFDRGLISLTNPESKIINLSGFDLMKLPKNTKLHVINFIFDEENQAFLQQDTTDIIPKKYLALKIGQDYTYDILAGKLTKFLNVSVFN